MPAPRFRGERGGALLELALLLPVLILIGYCAVEVSRAFQRFEAASTIAREAAKIGMKQCELRPVATVQDCINGVYATMATFATAALPGAEVAIQVWDYDDDEPHDLKLVAWKGLTLNGGVYKTTSGFPTRYSAESIDDLVEGHGGNPDTLDDDYKTRLVISEVFFKQRSTSPSRFILPLSALYGSQDGVLYETTLY